MILKIKGKDGNEFVFGGDFMFIAGPANDVKGGKKLALEVIYSNCQKPCHLWPVS